MNSKKVTMNKAFFLALNLLAFGLFGQMTIEEEITKVMDGPSGKIAFELEGNLEIYAYPSTTGWHKVSREAWINVDQLLEDNTISAGIELLDKDGDKIGKTVQELTVKDKRLVKGFRKSDQYVIIVEGYLFRSKFAENTMPETTVNALLANKNRSAQSQGFKDLFSLYNFEEKQYEGFTAYVMRENHKTTSVEKDFRIIIIFRGKSTVFSVICNGHSVKAPKMKATFEEADLHGIYIFKPSTKQKALIEEDLIYDFLPL